jgi:hypothetical protein
MLAGIYWQEYIGRNISAGMYWRECIGRNHLAIIIWLEKVSSRYSSTKKVLSSSIIPQIYRLLINPGTLTEREPQYG